MKTSIPASSPRKLPAFLWAIILPAMFAANAMAQTAPSAQTLPYSQNFGTTTFTNLPSGVAVWNGVSGGSTTNATAAAASVPSGNANLSAATNAQTGGGAYGYAASGNAQLYIQTSSNATNGVNQPVIAFDTTGKQNVVLGYAVSVISAQPRTVGVLAQYRVGTNGAWTSLTASSGLNPFSQAGGTTGLKTTVSSTLPIAAENQPIVQVRWAVWRGTETGNSSGVGIDDISVTGDPVGSGPVITSFTPSSGFPGQTVTISGVRFGATPAVRFNGVAAEANVNPEGTQITATVPSGATTGPITVEVAGEATATSATNFTVIAPGTPIITLSTNTITGLSTSVGVASAATSYVVTGTNLSDAVSIIPQPPPGFGGFVEVGTNGTDFSSSVNLFRFSDGTLSNTVYLRVVATNVVTNYSVTVAHISGTARVDLPVSGSITNPAPGLVLNPTNLPSFAPVAVDTPSEPQIFNVAGSNLTNDVTITAPTGFQVSNDGATWASSTSIVQSGGTASGNISVRFAASSAFGPRFGSVLVAASGITRSLPVSGSVPVPNVPGQVYWNFDTNTPTSGTGGEYALWTFGPLTQSNNNGTTALLNTTSASSSYTNPFNVLASGTINAGASARTGVLVPEAGATNGSAFFQVEIVVPSNTTTSITNISFGSRSTGTGPATYSIRSSADGFASDILTNSLTANSTWVMQVAPVSIALSNGTNTVRIYGFNGAGNATASTANWRIDDLTLALGTSTGPTPPSGLSYTPSSVSGVVGTAITNMTPTVTGTITNYSVSPTLPAGLAIDSTTGVISGTPTAVATSASYTVTASNAGGSTAANVTISVVSAYQAGYSTWLLTYPTLDPATTGLPTADPDGDGFSNASEYAFGTNPTVPNGALLSITTTNSVFRSSWNGPASGVSYAVQTTTNLSTTPFTNNPSINIQSTGGIMSFTNPATGNLFFRVRSTSN